MCKLKLILKLLELGDRCRLIAKMKSRVVANKGVLAAKLTYQFLWFMLQSNE